MSEDKSVPERLAVLETKVEDHTSKLDKFFERLDQHIVEESENDARLQSSMANLTDQLSVTNENLKTITTIVSSNNIKLVQIDTVWTTVAKIGSILVLLIMGGWGLFKYLEGDHIVQYHQESTQIKSH